MNFDEVKSRWNISIYNIGPLWCARFYPVARLPNAVIPKHAEAGDIRTLESKVLTIINATELGVI